jgi:hypothetical protein
MAYKFKKSFMANAVNKCNGTYTDLARNMKIKDANTAKNHLFKFPDLVKIFNKKKEYLVDVAESTLMSCLECETDAVRLSASRFILQRLDRKNWGDEDVLEDNSQKKLIGMLDKMVNKAFEVDAELGDKKEDKSS